MAVKDYYFAFISYSRNDEEYAKWLHTQFEHYNLPAHIKHLREELPESLSPVFRDEDELSCGYLSVEITQALKNSNWLVVLCSPNSASSNSYVNKEIECFIKTYEERNESKKERINHIIPIIISGKPYAQDSCEECFPIALRNLRNLDSELRAPNVNSSDDGWERSFIAAVSTMLSLPFDTLWDRRQREIEEANRKLIDINNRISLNHSRAVSSKAKDLIINGDNVTASLLMTEIITEKKQSFPTYCPEVESVLRMSLNSDTYKLEFNAGEVTKAIWSNDGNYIAALFEDNRIRIWKSSNGSELKIIEALVPNTKFSRVTDIIWKDHNHLIYSTNDGQIILLDLTNNHRGQLFATDYAVEALHYHQKSDYIGFLSKDNLFIISSEGGNLDVHKVDGKGFIDFTFSSPNSIYYIRGKSLYHYQQISKSDQVIDELSDDEFLKIAVSPQNDQLAVSTRKGLVHLYDINTFERSKSLCGHESAIWSIDYDSSGKLITTGDSRGCCAIWDVNKSSPIDVRYLHTSIVRSCALNHLWHKLLTCSKDGSVKITDLQMKDVIKSVFQPYHYNESQEDYSDNIALRYIYGSNRITASIFLDDQIIITASKKGVISLCNIESNEILSHHKLHDSEIRSLCLSFDKKYLISIGGDYNLHVSSLLDQKFNNIYSVKGCYKCIAEHPWKHQIAAIAYCNDINQILLIDYINKRIIFQQTLHTNIGVIAFSHSGEYLAIGTDNGDIYIMNSDSREILNIFKGHNKAVTTLAFSPIRNLLVSGSEDRTIRIWDLSKKKCINILEGHKSRIEYITFSNKGDFIISCGGDGNIATWDINRGCCLNSFYQTSFGKGIYAKHLQNKELIIYVAGEVVFLWNYPTLETAIKMAKRRDMGRGLTQEDREQYFLE